MKKAKLWAHATYEMVEHDEFCKKLNLPAYVRAENYDFIHQRSENVEAENARLKEAIADSYKAVDEMEKRFKELKAEFEMHPMAVEIVRLKAEVERLTERNQFLEQVDSYLQSANLYAEEQRSMELEAQVERLTKAGDAMAEAMWYGDNERSIWVKKFAETDWNRAKEGKHS